MNKVLEIIGKSPSKKSLDEILKEGTQRILQQALEIEIEELISPLLLSTITPFITKLGEVVLGEYDVENSLLFKSPIFQHRDLYIVVNPWMLLAAARHSIICSANELGLSTELSNTYLSVMERSVIESLLIAGWERLSITLPEPNKHININ